MGLTAIVSSAASATSSAASSAAGSASSVSTSSASASATSIASLLSPVGMGIGGVFVAAALIVLLAYFDILDAADGNETVRRTLVASIIPLALAFTGVVAFQSAAAL